MPDKVGRDVILEAVVQRGLFRSPHRISGIAGGALEGKVDVAGREVTLQLLLDAAFPLSLPMFLLQPWDALGFIPHVLPPDGIVCYSAAEGLVLDRDRPVEIITEALGRAIQTLSDGVTGRNHTDFVDELEVYWALLANQDGRAWSFIEPTADVRRVIAVTLVNADGQQLCITSGAAEFAGFWNHPSPTRRLVMQHGVAIPLEPGTYVVPPRPDGPFWTDADARQLLAAGLSATNAVRLQKLLRRPTLRHEYVVLQFTRPSGGVTLIGLRFDDVGAIHPLLDRGSAGSVIPLDLTRLDQSYLVARGGGDVALEGKRVLLVGVGAVGGHLAFELARAGILDLTLVDGDVLMPENSFRHVLGRRYWWQPKAKGLKVEIETQLPYVRITPVVASIERALARRTVDLAEYDLVVLATGDPTIELELNTRLQNLDGGPAAVFTWLEPLGIGGHALLAGPGRGGGCFACLYSSPIIGEDALVNRAAFAAPGQSFGLALSGCGSFHTPYGALDALRTAELAARLAVDALSGKETGNPLCSWKGDASAFDAAGFRVSNRFAASEAELHCQQYAYRSARCPVCNGRSAGSPGRGLGHE